MSISLLLLSVYLLVGVATSERYSRYDNGASKPPIALWQASRICASLCLAGLGGKPCGDCCKNMEPSDFPIQSTKNETTDQQHIAGTGNTRRNACTLLCKYDLGQPLCQCETNTTKFHSIFQVDFESICAFFCIEYAFKVSGCGPCHFYKRKQYEELADATNKSKYRSTIVMRPKAIDWETWCRDKCYEGDGGVACNCDILPVAMPLPKLPSEETPPK